MIFLLLLAHTAGAAYCNGKPSPDAQPNEHAIIEDAPTLMRTVPNGSAYRAGNDTFWVMHLYGSPYDMGYAHGTMMKEEVKSMVTRAIAYMESQVEDALKGLPTWLRDWVAQVGLDVALDLTAQWTAPFTGKYFFDELKGLADGAGVPYKDVLHIHLIGELTKGSCSMY